MKPRLVDLLVCPIHRTPLELVVWEDGPGDEIITGVLLNRAARLAYPIHAGVPRMLAFTSGVAEAFNQLHGARLSADFPGFRLPDAPGVPGEADVLRSFSTEWTDYGWNEQAYWNLPADVWFRCMRYVLGIDRRPIRDKLVLEVGIGIGGVADFNARVEGAEVVGVDLGYAVDAARRNFGANPRLHIVQASAFALPFRDASFDFVYSFGVIHHTFSTKTAFDGLARLPKRSGRLNIWVYSPHDEQRNLNRRALMALERVVRPVVWRLPSWAQAVALAPIAPLYIVHQAVRARGGGQVRYGWREAMHAARDRFTPRYIHRHANEEVAGWFASAGYEDLEILGERPRPDFVPVAFTACTGVDGRRA
jgi:uncharacterized protein YbaR (Trm112 family)